jgi:hypothetical protein
MRPAAPPPATAEQAFPLFEARRSVAEVATQLQRAHSTVSGYLAEFLRTRRVTDPSPWVDAATTARIQEASASLECPDLLKPIYDALGGAVDYDAIKFVLICRRNAESTSASRPG